MKYLWLIRAQQWIKNFFLFIPAFFAGRLFEIPIIIALIPGFISFSLVASSIYIINDLRDLESDRKHPRKKNRPLPAGKVSEKQGKIIGAICAVLGFAIAFYCGLPFFLIAGTYFLVNIAYSFGLKHIGILDVMLVSSGFLLRVLAGGQVTDIPVSQWLTIMIFLLALFLSISKRRDDLVLAKNSAVEARKSVKNYNLDFVNAVITLLAGILIVSYLMYTISPEITKRLNSEYVYVTVIFVLAGILRYLQITFVEEDSGSPIKVLYKDKFIIITLFLWMMTFFAVIYF